MDGNQFQNLTEAYKSVYESQEDLQEASAFIGGGIGPGGSRHVTVGGSAGGFSGSATFGSKKAKDTDAAAKAAVTNAVSDAQKNLKSDTDSKNVAAAPKTSQTTVAKPNKKSEAGKLGGELRMSSGGSTTAGPTVAAKVSEPEAKRVRFATGSFSGSAGGNSTPPKTPPRTTTTKTEDPKRPTDAGRKPEGPKINKAPDIRRPEGPKMDFKREESKRDFMRQDTTSDLDVYNLVLEYLLDEGFASTEQAADKIILNMSEEWFEDIMELNRYEKETGKDYKSGKPVKSGGAKDDVAYTTVKKSIRNMEGTPAGQRKKVRGQKPPKAGEYGGPASPAQKVAKRRADKKRGEEMMHSARD